MGVILKFSFGLAISVWLSVEHAGASCCEELCIVELNIRVSSQAVELSSAVKPISSILEVEGGSANAFFKRMRADYLIEEKAPEQIIAYQSEGKKDLLLHFSGPALERGIDWLVLAYHGSGRLVVNGDETSQQALYGRVATYMESCRILKEEPTLALSFADSVPLEEGLELIRLISQLGDIRLGLFVDASPSDWICCGPARKIPEKNRVSPRLSLEDVEPDFPYMVSPVSFSDLPFGQLDTDFTTLWCVDPSSRSQ